jgi:antitoxin MazE
MKVGIRRIGNSRGVILPKPLISQLDLGDSVELTVEKDAIVLRKPRRRVRVGWAAAARDLAEKGETGPLWPEFPNRIDKQLKW